MVNSEPWGADIVYGSNDSWEYYNRTWYADLPNGVRHIFHAATGTCSYSVSGSSLDCAQVHDSAASGVCYMRPGGVWARYECTGCRTRCWQEASGRICVKFAEHSGAFSETQPGYTDPYVWPADLNPPPAEIVVGGWIYDLQLPNGINLFMRYWLRGRAET